MPVNILMPALSPTMEKGNLAKWLKKEGDKVKPGDVIAEIETDKATMEYEAVDEGTLAKIVVPEGTTDVPVKALIAVLADEGEDVKAAAAAPGNAGRPPQPRLLFSPGATNGERDGHRPRPHSGFRPARPHHCARCRSGQVGPRDHGSRSAGGGAWRPSAGRREDPRAVRARFVRSCPARQHSQSDCAASPRSEAYDPPLLPDA